MRRPLRLSAQLHCILLLDRIGGADSHSRSPTVLRSAPSRLQLAIRAVASARFARTLLCQTSRGTVAGGAECRFEPVIVFVMSNMLIIAYSNLCRLPCLPPRPPRASWNTLH